eukprot:1563268-Alexandrium_andersonii.AAC.1
MSRFELVAARCIRILLFVSHVRHCRPRWFDDAVSDVNGAFRGWRVGAQRQAYPPADGRPKPGQVYQSNGGPSRLGEAGWAA